MKSLLYFNFMGFLSLKNITVDDTYIFEDSYADLRGGFIILENFYGLMQT